MNRWQSTGESGVILPRGISKQVYQWELMDSQVTSLVEAMADKAGLSVPKLEVHDGGTKNQWGKYYQKDNRLVIYRRWPGIIVHEFSHYIMHQWHPEVSESHGWDYWHTCTYLWRQHDIQVLGYTGVVVRRG